MTNRSDAAFIALLLGMAVAAGAFILSIPPLFSPHEPYQVWTTGILGGLSVALAVATLYARPTHRRPSGRDTDE